MIDVQNISQLYTSMQNKQSFIDGWKNQAVQELSPHRNHLKSLVQFIDKAKFESLRLHNKNIPPIFPEQANQREEKSYQSVKEGKKRLKTLTQRIKLRSFVQRDHELKAVNNTLKDQRQLFPLNKVKAMNFNSFLTFQEKVNPGNFDQSRPNKNLGKQKSGTLHKNRFKSQSSRQFSKFDNFIRRSITKKELSLSKKQRKQFDIKSLITLSNEQRMTRFKTILFKTIQDKKISKSPKEQNKYEIRLKNMLQKSNRKKKKLEKLFKVNQWINESKISNVLKASKIYHFETVQSAKSLRIAEKTDAIQNSSAKLLHIKNI